MNRLVATVFLALLATAPAQSQDFSVTGHPFLAILARDDAALADWYARAFDLREVNHLQSEGQYSIRILTGPALSVEIIRLESAIEPDGRPYGLFKSGFRVDSLEAAHAWFADLGADVDESWFTDEALGVRTFVFRDPEGNRLQAMEPCNGACIP